MRFISSLSSIIHRYDAFILDLWGVVHDGLLLYPRAPETLRQLKAAGKRAIFLSNAPRRARMAAAKLDHLGVSRSLYERVLTSGETAFEYLSNAATTPLPLEANGLQQRKWGRRCYFLGLEMDEHLLHDLSASYGRAHDLEQADFILNAGYETLTQNPEELRPRLERAAALKLPMLCVNPDIEIVRQSGEEILCAGQLARDYEAMGGAVSYIGKPHPLVYEQCLAHFSAVPQERILAVGDGLRTDILGANRAGLDSLLITGGILRRRLGEEMDGRSIEQACRERGAFPDYVLPEFA